MSRGGESAVAGERERVLALVCRHGWNATAFQTLETGYSYFFHGDDGCVAYVDTGGAWVAAGGPIAAADALADVAAAFMRAARAAGKRCCFFATEERLQHAMGSGLRALHIGEQPAWDPRSWSAVLARRRSLREQLRRARAKGVRIREVTAAELQAGQVHAAITRVAERWLGTRGLAPMAFLVRLELAHFPAYRRCFVAEIDGRLVGFAGVVPVPARGGWFIEDLVRDPEAPNGTGELLIDAVMRAAVAAERCWITLGLAPLAGDVAAPLRLARRSSSLLYDFEGLRAYKAKLSPDTWSAIHLSFPPTQGAVISVIDALAAFAGGGLLRFGLRSLLRGPAGVVRALALLLVPWTALLALAPAEQWFGSPWVKWAWVAFDVAVAAGLFRLLRRPTVRLAAALSSTVTLDAALTMTQAALWNLRHASGFLDHAVVSLACVAPALAAVVLWGATSTWVRSRARAAG